MAMDASRPGKSQGSGAAPSPNPPSPNPPSPDLPPPDAPSPDAPSPASHSRAASAAGAPSGGKVEIIHPPNLLKMKVGSGGVDPGRIARAEAAVAELAQSYLDWALKDLATLQSQLEKARAEPANRRQRLKELFQTAHDMKGQGSTFGYPLVTQVAKHLCHYIEGHLGRDSMPDLAVIGAHVDALTVVLRQRISGDGGAEGRLLVSELETLVERKLR